MTSFFLGCFAFGLIFTVAGFVLGALGSGHVHLPFHLHVDHAGHGGESPALSFFNVSTISAFLTWFGGAGYLLSRYSSFTAVVVVALSGLSGLAGGGIIFVTLSKYVYPRLTEMKSEDYQLPGTVARVTSPIRAGGTGEIVYTLAGTVRSDGARAVNGQALERGTEVVIVRVERGIAWVERWDSYAGRNDLPPDEPGPALPESNP